MDLSSEHDDSNLKYLLLEDTDLDNAPEHLRTLLQQIDLQTTSPGEILLLLVYIIAVESGYATTAEFDAYCNCLHPLLPAYSFQKDNVQLLCQKLPTYSRDDNNTIFSMRLRTLLTKDMENQPALNSLLNSMVSGEFNIITLMPDLVSRERGRSLCLSIGRYVLSGGFGKHKPFQHRFQNLKELSKLLRDELFVPVRNAQLRTLKMTVYPSFVGLPAELCDNIFEYLNYKQLKIVASVCKDLRDSALRIKRKNAIYNKKT